MKKQFAVIGLGRFGSSVARTLAALGHQVIAIDVDEAKVEAMMDVVTTAVQADARNPETLKAVGIRNVDVAVVSIAENIEANILVTLLVKEMGVKFVVAKAANDQHGKVLEKIGADKVIYPERDMGIRVAHNLSSGNVLDHIDLSSEYSIVEIVAPKRIIGSTLGQLNIRARHGVIVMAIKRADKIIVAPGADDVIEAGDIMVLVGENKDLEKLREE